MSNTYGDAEKSIGKFYSEGNSMFELFKMFPDYAIAKKWFMEKHRFNVYINRIESFWSTFKRTHKGAFQKMFLKHPDRYFPEFAEWCNMRETDTMNSLVSDMDYKMPRYDGLIADNGLPSEVR